MDNTTQADIILSAHQLTDGVERVLTRETALSLARKAAELAVALLTFAVEMV